MEQSHRLLPGESFPLELGDVMALLERCPVWRRLIASVCLVALCGCSLSGCNGSGPAPPKAVPVSGSVALNGQPVVGATVSFLSDNAPRSAMGITDKDGKFQLSTFALNDGAVVGDHKITVIKTDAPAGKSTAGDTATMNDPTKMTSSYTEAMASKDFGKPKTSLPEKYAQFDTTTLKETVTEKGPNQFVLLLAE